MESNLLTAQQVADLLNIRVSTVYDGVARGRIPAVKLWTGQRRALLRFRESDLREFIRTRALPAQASPPTGGTRDRTDRTDRKDR